MTNTTDERMTQIRNLMMRYAGYSTQDGLDLLAKIHELELQIEQLRGNTGGKRIVEQADTIDKQRASIRQAMRTLVSIEQESYAIECPSYEINIAIKALGEVYGE